MGTALSRALGAAGEERVRRRGSVTTRTRMLSPAWLSCPPFPPGQGPCSQVATCL